MLTMPGTPAARAASRPYRPGLGLWVWTMSGRSRRNSRFELDQGQQVVARRHRAGGVAQRHVVDSPPLSCATKGPGADTPMTSMPAAAKARSCGPSRSARLMSAGGDVDQPPPPGQVTHREAGATSR